MAAHFRWANGNTAATFRSQAGTDMELVMNSDNWLVKVCPDGTFTARGQQRLVESRAIAAACWFMPSREAPNAPPAGAKQYAQSGQAARGRGC